MAHFARVVDGIVLDVIVLQPEDLEAYASTQADNIEYIQCSYNVKGGVYYDSDEDGVLTPNPNQSSVIAEQDGRQRKNYPSSGYTYDEDLDAFIPPKPFHQWILNEETCEWEAPIAAPDDGNMYAWNEADGVWEQMTEADGNSE